MKTLAPLVFVGLGAIALPTWAGAWQPVKIEASMDMRYFPVKSAVTNDDLTLSQQGAIETAWRSDNRKSTFNVKLFGRWDEQDSGRRKFDVRKLWYRFQYKDLTLAAGIQQEFWGVTESRHLVNVLNQIDAVEDVDEEDLLGQPMVKLDYVSPIGRFAAYMMPYFRNRPRHEFRERLALPIRFPNESSYESGANKHHLDFAARYSWQRDSLDLSLSYFQGTNREPRLTLENGVGLDTYEQIKQWGLDAQWTAGPWLAKVEALHRTDAQETFSAFVLGIEYTLFQALGQADVSMLVERLKDHRRALGNPTPFQDDWFGAIRVAWNDQYDSSLLIGAYHDREHHETLLRVELERRLTARWSVDLSLTSFNNSSRTSPIYPIRRDGFASMKLTCHF
ncbi:MAG: hypothetical protein AB8C02_05165 [Halioglobus sp.]